MSMLSWSIYRKHGIAQFGATRAEQGSKTSTCRSEYDNVSNQTELARASTSSGIFSSV